MGRWLLRIATYLIILLLLFAVLPGGWVYLQPQGSIHEVASDVPAAPIAIVFGAGLQRNGEPSALLADRIDAAVELYKRGKVSRLLMTGDNREASYDEPGAMRRYAIERGIPAERIDFDQLGLRTHDSIVRARGIFGITRAVLVTQRYHLPRALYLADAFGIEASGYVAGHDHYVDQRQYEIREAVALVATWYEVSLARLAG